MPFSKNRSARSRCVVVAGWSIIVVAWVLTILASSSKDLWLTTRDVAVVSTDDAAIEAGEREDGLCDPNKRKRVIIVGAGAAGLTAAKRLVSLNDKCLQVKILEASSGFGGRVQKDTTGFASYPLDLGASWVFDPSKLPLIAQNPTLNLSQKTMAPGSKPNLVAYHIHRDGSHSEKSDNYDDENHLWVNYTWYEFFQDYVVEPSLREGDHLVYNCPVDRIVQLQDGNQIQLTCGERVFLADHVLVTVPLSILKDNFISFSPTLPRKLIKRINKSKMWQGFKIFLEFSAKFYYDVFEWSSDDGELDFWDYSFVQPKLNATDLQHILAGYYVGEPYQSKFQPEMDEETMVQLVLKDLDKAFGRKRASGHYLRHLIVHWSKNPFVRGIYSDRPVPERKRGGPQQVWSHGKLLVAGEAFPVPPKHNGWVDGAALSGLHAAELILRHIDPERFSTKQFSVREELWEEED